MNLLHYVHTIRYLKPVQLYGRIRYQLGPRKVPQLPAPGVREMRGAWAPVALREPRQTGPCRFRFLEQEHSVETSADWNDSRLPRLWLYNLHYFDDLNAAGFQERSLWHRDLILRWLAENPPGSGPGWQSYPLSLRLLNWIKWRLAGNELLAPALDSLAHQARYLHRNIEWHLLGNHLLANATALVFAGVFFQGPEPGQWTKTGLRILAQELPEQVLSDGAHIERSPMYHSLLLEHLLDLLNLDGAYPATIPPEAAGHWKQISSRMLCWLEAMCHPDGLIALFNDAAFGVASSLQQLKEYAGRLGIRSLPSLHDGSQPVLSLAPSGYVRLERDGAVVLFDAGPIGPDYQPAHGHADTLSFEMSLRGRRLLVNSGVSTYEPGPQRQQERGSAAHNTIQVDGLDQSELWASFRVARRAKPFDLHVQDHGDRLIAEASHDGYRRLRPPVIHRRRLELSSGSLMVSDFLEGAGNHQVDSFFHLAPDWEASASANVFSIRSGGSAVATIVLAQEFQPLLENSSYPPRFGVSEPNRTIHGQWSGPCPVSFVTRIEWN